MCTPKSFDLNVASVSFSPSVFVTLQAQRVFAANLDSHLEICAPSPGKESLERFP